MNLKKWKKLPNYPYEVSTEGDVRRIGNDECLKQGLHWKGYLCVSLWKGGKQWSCRVHRLVLLTFRGRSVKEVHHKNGIKTDNRLSNLQYATRRQNNRYRVEGVKGFYTQKGYRYRVRPRLNGKMISLGSYKTKKEAQKVYKEFARKHP